LKYKLLYCVAIPVGGLFGAIIGIMVGHGNVNEFFMRSSTISGVVFLFLVGLWGGITNWHRNEKMYKLLSEKNK